MEKTTTITQNRRNIEWMLLMYLLTVVFPYDLIIQHNLWTPTLRISAFILFLFYYRYYQRKVGLLLPVQKVKVIALTWMIPLITLTISNIIYLWILNEPTNPLNPLNLLMTLPVTILVVMSEELLFRGQLIQHYFANETLLKRILFSSLVFAALHLLNLFSGIPIGQVLLQVVYTWVLGMVLGTAYAFTQHMMVPIMLHFCFNVVNQTIYQQLAVSNPNWLYFVVNSLIGILVMIYCLYLLRFVIPSKHLQNEEM